MWDLAKNISHWRNPGRKASLSATILFVASFLCSLLSPTLALAIDASWAGQDLSYDGKTFAKAADIKAGDKRNPVVGTHVYEYSDASTKSLEVLYIDKGTTDVTKATMAQYVIYKNFTPPDTFSEMSSPQTVTIATTTQSASNTNTKGTSSCDSTVFGGMSWILCQLSRGLATATDGFYKFISGLLVVTTLTVSQDNSIYRVWKIVVSIANICFIFAFLYVVYTHLVNVNVDKYHMFKKTLPRLLVAAILVNISYWLCALAVDASNLLGYSIDQIFVGIRKAVGVEVNIDWTSITNYILSAGAIGGAAIGITVATGALATAQTAAALGWMLIAALVPAIFAIMVAFIVLAVRQALIVTFIIISPLAMVAWVLPNTEKYFEKWLKAFSSLLLMFPIFSVVFGGATLAGASIINSANGSLVLILIGLATQAAPLVITPMLIKFSTGVLGQIANITNNKQRGLLDRSKNAALDRAGFYKDKNLARNTRKYALFNRAAQRSFDNKIERENNRETFKDTAKNRANEKYYRRLNTSNRRKYQELRSMRRSSHEAQNVADIYKENLDAADEQHWANTLQNSARLQQLKHQSHVASGSAKVITDRLEAANERALQEHINTNADLRKLRVDATLDQGLAKLNTAQVDAAGELELKNVILGDRALRNMVVNTMETENRAEVAEEVVKGRAKAHWDHISRSDAALQRLRLKATQESDNAKLAEQEWNVFLENARTKGSGYSEIDSSRAAQQAADAIRDINRRSQEAGSAQDTAKSIQQFGYAKSLESDAAALARATGIGTAEDSSRVLAKAKSTVSRAYVEDAQSIQSTMPYDLSTNVPELKRQFESSTEIPMARRLAMVWATAQNGNFGYEQAREMIDWYVKHGGEGGGRPTDSDIRDFKELIKVDSSLSKGDRALELYLNEGVDLGKTLEDFTNDMGTWNIKTSRFAEMGETRQLEAIKVWQANGKEGQEMLDLVRADILSTPTLRSATKKKVKIALGLPLSPNEEADTSS